MEIEKKSNEQHNEVLKGKDIDIIDTKVQNSKQELINKIDILSAQCLGAAIKYIEVINDFKKVSNELSLIKIKLLNEFD